MSRGPGHVEQAILRRLKRHHRYSRGPLRNNGFTITMLALGIYVDDEPTAPQLAAVRRAVRNLARRDLVHVNRIYRRTTTKIYHNQGAYPDWSYEAPIGELEVHWGSAFDAFETER